MADPTNNPNPAPTPPTEPQTFSKDYVDTLRSESAGYRTRAKTAEATVKAAREAFGLKPDEDIGDLAARLTAREAQALEKANARLIAAEIKALAGYDTALLERLIDRKAIKVDDNGKVSGVKEAAEAVAKQFPAVAKKAQARDQWAPTNPAAGEGGTNNPNQAMNDLLRGK